MTLNDKIKQLMNEHPDLFPTEAKVWAYIRGCMRRGFWEKSPMKHRFKSSKTTPPPKDYTGRGRKGADCSLTGEWTMTSQLEVDHKDGHKPLRSEEHILPYLIHLLASNNEELQLASKEAHKIKSYSERMDISYEEAAIRKKIIAFKKLTLPQMQDKIWAECDVDSSGLTSKAQAVKVYEQSLRGNKDGN